MAFSALHEQEAATNAAQEQNAAQQGFYQKQVLMDALRSPNSSLSDLEKQFLGKVADYLQAETDAAEVGPTMTANAAYQVLLTYNGQAGSLARDLRGILASALHEEYASEVCTDVGARSKIQKAPWYVGAKGCTQPSA